MAGVGRTTRKRNYSFSSQHESISSSESKTDSDNSDASAQAYIRNRGVNNQEEYELLIKIIITDVVKQLKEERDAWSMITITKIFCT